ncbi:hypothetical protein COLO4_24004 [Corchorus olitorius]|uniref:Uncharacterized protein n=1 Tax=Corchorus olitorius TaxID=93759 RepID=A0A1R3IDM0_9ROSI|nr:hypothetical protein COLO4_24004 [Corchorus olitorius]
MAFPRRSQVIAAPIFWRVFDTTALSLPLCFKSHHHFFRAQPEVPRPSLSRLLNLRIPTAISKSNIKSNPLLYTSKTLKPFRQITLDSSDSPTMNPNPKPEQRKEKKNRQLKIGNDNQNLERGWTNRRLS